MVCDRRSWYGINEIRFKCHNSKEHYWANWGYYLYRPVQLCSNDPVFYQVCGTDMMNKDKMSKDKMVVVIYVRQNQVKS